MPITDFVDTSPPSQRQRSHQTRRNGAIQEGGPRRRDTYQLCLLQCKGEAQMILKVTVLKGGVDVFTAHIDVGQPSELSKGVKAALDEFHRVSPKTPLLDGDIQIKLDKA